jgi:hypothetical protein
LKARLASATVAAAMILAAPARGQEKGEACATAYEQAQQLVKQHSPLRARTELRLCLSACPTVLARDCSGWLASVEPQVASLRITTLTWTGAPTRATLTVDDRPATPEGDRVDVDPGEHHVVARDPDGALAETRVTVAAGQRDVIVSLRFPPPPPAPVRQNPPIRAPLPPPPNRTAPFVIGTVGIAALGAGGVLGLAGQLQRSDLASSCAPNCDPGKVDQIRTEWIVGGVAAGAGLLAVTTAIVLLASERRPATSATSWMPTSLVVSF